MSDTVDAAADELYAAPPDEFMGRRTELAAAAKSDGDAAAAKQIAALRKPTVAASLVNRVALGDASAAARLAALGDELRVAHDELDAARLRELTADRRALVAELTKAALRGAGASAAVREEVGATWDAAVADPDVTARLGRLTKAERWSGFGVAAGPPSLTVVRGGRAAGGRGSGRSGRAGRGGSNANADGAARRGAGAGTSPAGAAGGSGAAAAKPAVPAATRRKLTRMLDRARDAFAAAEADLTAATEAEATAAAAVQTLTAELAELTRQLERAKRDRDSARKSARSAHAKRREARSALDRAERNAERGG